jgi:dipeptidyl-peptidase-4
MEPLSKNGPQQVPLFSPDGFQVAFVRNNNIFLVKLLFGNSESQVTKDGEYNKVLNGIPDWVYEEEFSFNRAFDFSADSKMIAYIRMYISRLKMSCDYLRISFITIWFRPLSIFIPSRPI